MIIFLLISIGPLMAVAIGSTVLALLSAPLSLFGRWLVLRRTPAAEPAGTESQSHP